MAVEATPHIAARAAVRSRSAQGVGATSRYDTVPMTGFYPLYDGDEDQVDRVAPISSIAFQRVIPRYRLSSSATRDTGLGPAFYDIPVYRSAPAAPSQSTRGVHRAGDSHRNLSPIAPLDSPPRRTAPLYPWQGGHVDMLV